jgi:hypothetical protein
MRSLAEVMCPGVRFATGCNYRKVRGSRVMIGNNRGPIYEIVHIAGATAWVRPLGNGGEGLVPLDRLRTIAVQPACGN